MAERKIMKERRIEKGFKTQEDLCYELEIDLGTYKKVCNGGNSEYQTLKKIANALDCSIDFVVGRTDYLNIGNKEIVEITGLSDNSIEVLRTLNRMATTYPGGVVLMNLPTFYLHPDGAVEKVTEAKPVPISERYADDPCAEPSAIIETLNDLLETTQIDHTDYMVDSALLQIAEYIRADKAIADELKQYEAPKGHIIQPITFRDGLMDKAMDARELYREVKKKHIIAALDEVISTKEKQTERMPISTLSDEEVLQKIHAAFDDKKGE